MSPAGGHASPGRGRSRTPGGLLAGLVAALVATTISPRAAAGRAPAPPPPDTLPPVLVVTTGGTIASRPDAPSLEGSELVSAVPELADHARVEVEEFSRIGSSAMTPRHWLELARLVRRRLAEDDGPAGVVVTHGTDSMEETAYFLHLTVDDPRPVVLTGAMRSATAVSADGPANLLQAVRVAVGPSARDLGTIVVLNGEIHAARDVRKMDNLRLDAFRSPGTGALGWVDPDTVVVRRRPERAASPDAIFDPAAIEALPRVSLVPDFTGADGAAVRGAVARGADGLVVVGFGGGRLSPGTGAAARDAARGGTPVLVASRVPGGRILERRVAGEDGPLPMAEAGLAVARDLAPWKARILLMLALTRTRDAGEIQRIVDGH